MTAAADETFPLSDPSWSQIAAYVEDQTLADSATCVELQFSPSLLKGSLNSKGHVAGSIPSFLSYCLRLVTYSLSSVNDYGGMDKMSMLSTASITKSN